MESNDATPKEIDKLRRLTHEVLLAGALDFSTSRTLIHKGANGKHVPGTFSRQEELFAIGRALGDTKRGVFQMTSNPIGMDLETTWMRKLAAETGQPVAFNVQQIDSHPDLWKTLLQHIDDAGHAGVPLYGAFCGRPVGLLFLWGGTFHPFLAHPSCQPLRKLSASKQYAALLNPTVRAKLLAEKPYGLDEQSKMMVLAFHKMFKLGTRHSAHGPITSPIPPPVLLPLQHAAANNRTKSRTTGCWKTRVARSSTFRCSIILTKSSCTHTSCCNILAQCSRSATAVRIAD